MSIFLIILGIVIAVVGVVVGGAALVSEELEHPGRVGLAGVAVFVIGAVTLVFGLALTTVDARSIGIETKGGKYVGVLTPGRHILAPWADVEQWTTRNQTIQFSGDDGEDRDNFRDESSISVRLGNQSVAQVDMNVTWAVADSGGDLTKQAERIKQLWAQYKTFGDMSRDFAVVTARAASGDVFNVYDPFSSLSTAKADNPYVPNSEWSQKITDKLRPLYEARGLTLVSVQVVQVGYDKDTEAKIKQYSQKVADTRIAEQDVKVAEQQALASKQRSTQAAAGCEALIRDLAASDQLKNLPAGWQCPGSNGGAVIVGGQK